MKTFKIELEVEELTYPLRTEGTDIASESKDLLDWADSEGWTPVKYTGLKSVETLKGFGTVNVKVKNFTKNELSQLASI